MSRGGARGSGPAAGRPSVGRTGSGRPDQELVLDPIACVGHGLCAELFPEGVVLDDWGFPVVRGDAHDPALRDYARRAVAACPALALRLRSRQAEPGSR